jgi:mannosyl-oligosaccharide alpha-1,2-mannosidase
MLRQRRFQSRVPLLFMTAAVVYLFYGFPSLRTTRPSIEYVRTSYNWRDFPQRWPVADQDVHPLPTGHPKALNRVQADFSRIADSGAQEQRQEAVRAAFEKSWGAYRTHAWGSDELLPVTGGRVETYGGYAATLVDALDTLWIMGLKDEFHGAVRLVARIDWMETNDTALNLFELTIRHLGGLLGAYDLSQEKALLDKAVELGDMLLAAFDTPNRMPNFWLNFVDVREARQVAGTNDPSASPTTLSMELTRLAQLTGENRYYDAVHRVTQLLARTQDKSRLPGMWPTTINFREEKVDQGDFSIGALADSLYEYLLKMHLLTGGLEPVYEELYRKTIKTIEDHLLFRGHLPPTEQDLLFVGRVFVDEATGPHLRAESEHLACFAGGMFGLGGKVLDGLASHVAVGEQLARGCAWVYAAFPTGLMPEIYGIDPCTRPQGCGWDEEEWFASGDLALPRGFTHAREPRYMLRPEAAESLFVLWRITGKAEFREAAWRMFQAVVGATETELAFSAIEDVTVAGETRKTDAMQSFWLAETLKYFYLIFSAPGDISLDEWVLNTEAHPFRRPGKRGR